MNYKNLNLNNSSTYARNSSIELLKIIGIVLIVICHVLQTLNNPNALVDGKDYVLEISTATKNIQQLLLAMLMSSGALGNTIFFICSAWFLLDSDKVSKRKILHILLDVWAVSLLIFVIVYILRDGNIEFNMIIKQILPTTFGNNWYMTCYLLFYSMHPFLNLIIKKITQKNLFRVTAVLSFLYILVNFIFTGEFFTSELILWVTIYFLIAYIKYYLVDISNNIKVNIALFIIGFMGNYGMVLLTNYMGLYISAFSDKVLRWGSNCSPFIIMMVIGMLNIARNKSFKSNIINQCSKMSLLIYIIHENMLLRNYYRPLMWQYVYEHMGYSHVLLWMFVIVIIVFVFGLIASIVYKCTIQKCVSKVVNVIYPLIRKGYINAENFLLRLH